MGWRGLVSRSLMSTARIHLSLFPPRRFSSSNPRLSRRGTTKDIDKGSERGDLVVRHGEPGALFQGLTRGFYARYAGDLLVGIMGCKENFESRIAHFLQGLNQGLDCKVRADQHSTEFLGIVIRVVPPRNPIKYLRELENRIRFKRRVRILATCKHSWVKRIGPGQVD